MELVRLIIVSSCKSSVLVTGESGNVADSLAARLYCSCTVGTELVGWVGIYDVRRASHYSRRLCRQFCVSIGSHCALISKPIFSRCPCPMYNFSKLLTTLLFSSTCGFSFLALRFDCSQVRFAQFPVCFCDLGVIEAC